MNSKSHILYIFFSCITRPARDRKFGSRMGEPQAWNGMVGELAEGKADVIVSTLDNTLIRSTAVKFLVPLWLSW